MLALSLDAVQKPILIVASPDLSNATRSRQAADHINLKLHNCLIFYSDSFVSLVVAALQNRHNTKPRKRLKYRYTTYKPRLKYYCNMWLSVCLHFSTTALAEGQQISDFHPKYLAD